LIRGVACDVKDKIGVHVVLYFRAVCFGMGGCGS
jgi:hypothetical protein